MDFKLKFIIAGVALMVSGHLFSQVKEAPHNRYSYLHYPSHPDDSVKLKSGFWIEVDTSTSELSAISNNGTRGKLINFSIMISTANGNYKDGNKNGIWKYYDSNNKPYKEIEYLEGQVHNVKYIYSNGVVSLFGYGRDEDKFHYDKYDKGGREISEGIVPIELISSGMNYK